MFPPKLEHIINKALEKRQGGWWRHVYVLWRRQPSEEIERSAVHAQAYGSDQGLEGSMDFFREAD